MGRRPIVASQSAKWNMNGITPSSRTFFCSDAARVCHRASEVCVDNLLVVRASNLSWVSQKLGWTCKCLSDTMDTSSCPKLSLSLRYYTITQPMQATSNSPHKLLSSSNNMLSKWDILVPRAKTLSAEKSWEPSGWFTVGWDAKSNRNDLFLGFDFDPGVIEPTCRAHIESASTRTRWNRELIIIIVTVDYYEI